MPGRRRSRIALSAVSSTFLQEPVQDRASCRRWFDTMQPHAMMHCQATWGSDVHDDGVAGEGLVHRTSQQCRAWSDKQKLQQHKEAAGMERRPSILVSATPKPVLLPHASWQLEGKSEACIYQQYHASAFPRPDFGTQLSFKPAQTVDPLIHKTLLHSLSWQRWPRLQEQQQVGECCAKGAVAALGRRSEVRMYTHAGFPLSQCRSNILLPVPPLAESLLLI